MSDYEGFDRSHPYHPEHGMYDYRCPGGHIFASPAAPHGGPWSTLICPTCGATAPRHFTVEEQRAAEGADG